MRQTRSRPRPQDGAPPRSHRHAPAPPRRAPTTGAPPRSTACPTPARERARDLGPRRQGPAAPSRPRPTPRSPSPRARSACARWPRPSVPIWYRCSGWTLRPRPRCRSPRRRRHAAGPARAPASAPRPRRARTSGRLSVFTIIDGAVITLFDGPRPRSGRAWAGCREAVDASSRYAAPSLLLRPAFDRGRWRVRAGPAPVPGSTHPSKCPWTRMLGSASGCCSACGFDADRHAMLLQSFASEGSTSYAKQQPAERRDRLAALTLVTRRRNAHTGSMSTEALMC